jgi:hypothetical protein
MYYAFLMSPTRATRNYHLILLALITLIMFGEVYKLRSYTFGIFSSLVLLFLS